MKIKILAIGKTDSKALAGLIDDYVKRANRFLNLEIETLPDLKNARNLSEQEQMRKEAEAILSKISTGDTLVLMDERGKEFSSVEFAKYLQKQMNSGTRNLVFVIGGPYGLHPMIKEKTKDVWSLSKLTFSHQMVRLFAVEQIYRALTILRNQPYHHR